jgi:predicted metal-dependent hydrolase
MGEVIRLDDPAVLVRLHRSARARRFTLSLREGREAHLTAPAHAPHAETVRFLDRHRSWLREALARVPQGVAVGPGAVVPVGGVPLRLETGPSGLRAPRIEGESLLLPPGRCAATVTAAFLTLRAQGALVPAVQRAAARLGRPVGRISFRDTRSRWGSCTSQGDLMFSWRLAMAPTAVQDYVAVHEAAHLVEMNHGPRFWALVAEMRPDWRVQRAWLRREGPGLHRFRFRDALT